MTVSLHVHHQSTSRTQVDDSLAPRTSPVLQVETQVDDSLAPRTSPVYK